MKTVATWIIDHFAMFVAPEHIIWKEKLIQDYWIQETPEPLKNADNNTMLIPTFW